jgi:uncharacterized membrane protein
VKDSDFVKWHAKQGLVLGISIFVVSFVLMFIPVLGSIISCLMFLGWLVGSIMAIMKALNGVRWRIPVIADLADKF